MFFHRREENICRDTRNFIISSIVLRKKLRKFKFIFINMDLNRRMFLWKSNSFPLSLSLSLVPFLSLVVFLSLYFILYMFVFVCICTCVMFFLGHLFLLEFSISEKELHWKHTTYLTIITLLFCFVFLSGLGNIYS